MKRYLIAALFVPAIAMAQVGVGTVPPPNIPIGPGTGAPYGKAQPVMMVDSNGIPFSTTTPSTIIGPSTIGTAFTLYPVGIGGRAALTTPVASADGGTTALLTDAYGNVGTFASRGAITTVAISFTAAGGPTQLIAASGTTQIIISHLHIVLNGAGTFQLVTGTGSNCGTGTTYLEGSAGHPLSFAANGGMALGDGTGVIYAGVAGGAICVITTGAVDTSGLAAYKYVQP